VPLQRPAFEATRLAQGENAFEIGNWGGTLPVPDRGLLAVSGIGFIGDHSIKKARRRQLFLGAHDDDPAAARDKTQGVLRAQLTCLVDDEEIEIDRTRGRNGATETGLMRKTGLIFWIVPPAAFISLRSGM